MRARLLAAALLGSVACGYQPPRECGYICRLQLADGGCFAGPPVCTAHCGGPTCPQFYELVEDAGTTCSPIPAGEQLFCA
jgi:hypothetical protein